MEKEHGNKMVAPTYLEYIFNLIYINENMNILNTNENLFVFMEHCTEFYDNGRPFNLFDQELLVSFETSIRVLAHIIFERIPKDEQIELHELPTLRQFKTWIKNLTPVDFYNILFCLKKRIYGSFN